MVAVVCERIRLTSPVCQWQQWQRDVSFVIWQLLLWLSFGGVMMSQPEFLPPLITAAPVFPDICKGQWGAAYGRWQCETPFSPLQVCCDAFAFASSMRTSNNTEDNGSFIHCAVPSSDSPGFLKPLLNLLSLLLAVWLQDPVSTSWVQNSTHSIYSMNVLCKG